MRALSAADIESPGIRHAPLRSAVSTWAEAGPAGRHHISTNYEVRQDGCAASQSHGPRCKRGVGRDSRLKLNDLLDSPWAAEGPRQPDAATPTARQTAGLRLTRRQRHMLNFCAAARG